VDMYLTHIGIRIQEAHSRLLEKVVFLDPKRLLPPLGRGKKNIFFYFECYDLTNGKE
jgi:hypothetical protein